MGNTNITNNTKLLSVKELAGDLGVKIKTIYNWVYGRQIPHYKLGSLVKFKRSEIENWIISKKVAVFNVEEFLDG